MSRTIAALVLLTLLTPVALAAPDAGLPENAPQLPDLRPVGHAIATGAAKAADATGDAIGALASGAAALAKGAAKAIGAVFAALGHALAAIGGAIATAAKALGALLAAVGAALATLGLATGRAIAAHPEESAIVAGGATGLGLLALAAKKWWLSLFVPLYSRLARSEMLDNKVRARVFDHVKTHPGAHPSGIASALGLGWGTTVYHLARLEESSLVTAREAHNRKCYFVVGGELDNAGRSAVAAMSTDKARAIVDALRASPGMSQKQLADALGISQALLSWHVKRLVQSGVVVSVRDGRSNLLHVAEHVPVLAQPVAALAA